MTDIPDNFMRRLDAILCGAFGVDRVEQIALKFVDHIPHAPVTIPLMRFVGGPWAVLLAQMEDFTAEQRTKLVGAGAGVQLEEEGRKATMTIAKEP